MFNRKCINTIVCCFVLLLPMPCCPYKILIFVPGVSASNAILCSKIGDALASAGHNVTLFSPTIEPNSNPEKFTKLCKVVRTPGLSTERWNAMHEMMSANMFVNTPIYSERSRKTFSTMGQGLKDVCRSTFHFCFCIHFTLELVCFMLL
jgi:hypothetical protein